MRAGNKSVERAKQPKIDDRGRRRNAARKARRLMEKKADSMPVVELRGPKQERVVDADMVDPAPRGGLAEVFQQRYLLKLIVTRQLAQMYAASLLGLLWSYIQPALRFIVYFFIFGVVLKTHGGTHSIWNNRALVLKMRVPREIFPVATMVVAAYHTGPQILILAVACALLGWHFSLVGLAAGLLGLAILICFSMALSLIFAALNVFFKDFQNIVQTMTQFLHFLVPMMYSYSYIAQLGENHRWAYELYFANPLAEAVMLMQRLFWAPTLEPSEYADEFPPDLWERGFIMLVACLILLLLAQKFFSRLEGKFPERL